MACIFEKDWVCTGFKKRIYVFAMRTYSMVGGQESREERLNLKKLS
jgi:hypothetical protein